MNSENATGVPMRRVDLVDGEHDQVVSLCFAASRDAVERACPGARFIGTSEREDVELPAVAMVAGSSATDWLQLLDSPTPRLADLDYLDN